MLTSARLVSSVFWTCHRQGQDVGSLGSLVCGGVKIGAMETSVDMAANSITENRASFQAGQAVTLVRVVGGEGSSFQVGLGRGRLWNREVWLLFGLASETLIEKKCEITLVYRYRSIHLHQAISSSTASSKSH